MDNTFEYVSGKFVGNFFTHQKSVLSVGEKIPDGGLHNVHIYKGELTEPEALLEFKPQDHLNRHGMLLHNVTNVQITPGPNAPLTDKRICNFDQLVLKNVVVENSWQSDNKTYGILKGELVGKISTSSTLPISFDNTPPIPPPPIGGNNPPPPIIDNNGGWNKYVPPIINNNQNGGCFSSVWKVLKWILLLLLFMLLLKQCDSFKGIKSVITNDCDEEKQLLTDTITTQQHVIDSLIHVIRRNDSICNSNLKTERLQCEIDNLSSEIYFYGGKVKIRKYSENQLDKIVKILSENEGIKIEVRGYYNGSQAIILPEFNTTIDEARALTIKDLLIAKGIDANSITAIGMGESTVDPSDELIKMIIDGETFAWNANMRVEIKIATD
jgi:outer membrane protein OmpA-like peptidoglycan-associated protein